MWAMPSYEMDEDIDISMRNEKTSEKDVKKQREKWATMEKE